ncbi:MAG: TonB-dependent receptor [Opitutales bacterium]|nr:TonB-dependent receptor [Opitutales bacterium]
MIHRSSSFFSALLLLCVFALFGAGATLHAQTGTVRGTVSEAGTGLNLEGVVVRIPELDLRTTTDRSGRFAFRNVPAGTFAVSAQFLGYPPTGRTVEVIAGEETPVRLVFTADDVVELDDFVVVSGPTANERALARQRSMQNIADIASSDALGNFPDKTLADAVRRLPGITIERGPGEGEGRYVTVRGLNSDFNSVALDGVPVTVSNFDGASRSVPLDVVSTSSADSVEVTKTLRPDDNADSIGGLITIRSRSAFDREGRFLSGRIGGYYNRMISRYGSGYYLNEWGYEGSFGYSDFLNEAQTIGLSLNLNFREAPYASQSMDTQGFAEVVNSSRNAAQAAEGAQYEGLLAPLGVMLQEYFDEVKNKGMNAVLDFRPNDQVEYQIGMSWSRRDSRRGRQRQEIRFDDDYRYWNRTAPVTVVGDTVTEFTSDNRLLREVRDFYEEQNHYTLRFNSTHRVDDVTLTFLAGFQRGQFDGDPDRDMQVRFRTDFGDHTYRLDPNDPYFPEFSTERDRMDPSEFEVNRINLGTRFITDDEWIFGGDLQWEFNGGQSFLKTGLQFRYRTRDYQTVDRFYDRFTVRGGGLPTWFLDEAPDGGGPVTANYHTPRTVGNRYEFGFFLDPTRVRQVVDHLLASGQLEFSEDGLLDSINRSLVRSYDLSERIYSTYLMGQTVRDRWTYMAGVRVEHTRVGVDTFSGTENADYIFDSVVPVRGSNAYTNFFPHLHARYDWSEDLIVRLAGSSTLQRASYRQLNPSESIDNAEFTVLRGSTELKPTRSHNLDLMVDYYFGRVGRVGAGVFYKDMKDNIYRLNSIEDGSAFPGGIAGENYEVSEFRNARGAEVYGIELSFNTDLRFLPSPFDGLELFGNFTYIESDVNTGLEGRENIKTPLFGQVEFSYNVGIAYYKHGLNVRVAYNWRDSYLAFNGLDVDPRLDEYVDRLGQIDITISYDLPRGFSVYAEFMNVLNSPDRAYFGERSLRPAYNEYRDWSAYFGIRWSM